MFILVQATSPKNSKSWVGGHYYFSSANINTPGNEAILTLSAIIKHFVSSATKAKLAALFYNCKNAIPLHLTLEELGHHQPPTTIVTDNETAHGLLHKTMVPNASKYMDMCFNWLKCRQAQSQFSYTWQTGKNNLADYHTKHHPAKHRQAIRTTYVMDISEHKPSQPAWPLRVY